jgi:hypothetical protein
MASKRKASDSTKESEIDVSWIETPLKKSKATPLPVILKKGTILRLWLPFLYEDTGIFLSKHHEKQIQIVVSQDVNFPVLSDVRLSLLRPHTFHAKRRLYYQYTPRHRHTLLPARDCPADEIILFLLKKVEQVTEHKGELKFLNKQKKQFWYRASEMLKFCGPEYGYEEEYVSLKQHFKAIIKQQIERQQNILLLNLAFRKNHPSECPLARLPFELITMIANML